MKYIIFKERYDSFVIFVAVHYTYKIPMKFDTIERVFSTYFWKKFSLKILRVLRTDSFYFIKRPQDTLFKFKN